MMGISEMGPIGVRLPEKLRNLIDEAAKANSRSRNSEIVARLSSSFEKIPNGYKVAESDPVAYIERIELSEIERSFVSVFRNWGPEKQLAFLSLFKE